MSLRKMLKPCPVCGGTHLVTEEIKAGYGCVRCTRCGFEFPDGADGMDMYAPDELVRRWNSIKRGKINDYRVSD